MLASCRAPYAPWLFLEQLRDSTVGAFMNMIEHTLLDLLAFLESICAVADPVMQEKWLCALYLKEPATNFSTEVLVARPSNLAVVHTSGLDCSDLGEPERVLSNARAQQRGCEHENRGHSTELSNLFQP